MSEDLKDEQPERDSVTEAREQYAERLKERIANGDTLTDQELSFLESVDDESAEIPARMRIKRPKVSRTPKQQEQSMRNIAHINKNKLQTGPTTAEGKANSSKNAIQHGLHAQRFMNFIKPCLSTCKEYPCALVEDGATEPGSYCMEKHNFVSSLDAIEKAIVRGDLEDFKGLMAVELSANLQVVQALREHVIQSPLVMSIKHTKTSDTETIQRELKPNPAALAYTQLLRDLGINFKEAMITPRQVAQHDVADRGAEALAVLAGKASKRLKGTAPPKDEGGSDV